MSAAGGAFSIVEDNAPDAVTGFLTGAGFVTTGPAPAPCLAPCCFTAVMRCADFAGCFINDPRRGPRPRNVDMRCTGLAGFFINADFFAALAVVARFAPPPEPLTVDATAFDGDVLALVFDAVALVLLVVFVLVVVLVFALAPVPLVPVLVLTLAFDVFVFDAFALTGDLDRFRLAVTATMAFTLVPDADRATFFFRAFGFFPAVFAIAFPS